MNKLILTQQRKCIMEAIGIGPHHPTAEEVFEEVRRVITNISLATVYRNLNWMAQRGWIRKLDSAGGKARFDGNTQPHYHVRCTNCGALDDVKLRIPEDVMRSAQQGTAFRITGYQLDFLGLCPRCLSGIERGAQDTI